MIIDLKPETEALIRQDVQRGAYPGEADFIERAVAILHEQEEWLSANRSEFSRRLEAGYASARNGHLIDAEDVKIHMAARKQEWLARSRK